MNILEGCRHYDVKHLMHHLALSMVPIQTKPFKTSDNIDHPLSLYAATKKSNELMAHTYSHLYNLSTTGLRFFTVYGPWGRPDMALFKFTKAVVNDETIDVYNHGKMMRDFTYVDDIVEAISRLIQNLLNRIQNGLVLILIQVPLTHHIKFITLVIIVQYV